MDNSLLPLEEFYQGQKEIWESENILPKQGTMQRFPFVGLLRCNLINNMKTLMEKIALDGTKSTGFFAISKNEQNALWFRHVVFLRYSLFDSPGETIYWFYLQESKSMDSGSDTAYDNGISSSYWLSV